MPVYLASLGSDGPVKIGFTRDVNYRLVQLQRCLPAPLHIIRILDGGSAVERRLHIQFAHRRLRGEWFDFDDAMLGDLGAADLPRAVTYLLLHRVPAKRGTATFPVRGDILLPHQDAA